MKTLLIGLLLVSVVFAGKVTNSEIVTAPTITVLNEKLAKMVSDYIVVSVSEPVQIANEIAVTVCLGNPPGLTSVEIITAANPQLLNTALSELVSEYAVTSVSMPVQLPNQYIGLTTKTPANSTVKQLCVTVSMGKP